MISELQNLFPKAINLYVFGSHVYGSNNEKSDIDLIIISDNIQKNKPGFDLQVYSCLEFQNKLDEHDIAALECFYLSSHLKKENIIFNFYLDLKKLRHSVSKTASNSFVKAKKKLLQNDIELAQKSIYHSFRILDFGIQIAKYNKIINFAAQKDILQTSKNIPPDWNVWNEKFKRKHNLLATEFRKYAN